MDKKAWILAFLSCFCYAVVPLSYSQDTIGFKYILKTNPLAALGGPILFATGEYRVIAEQKLGPKQSILLGLGYVGPSPTLGTIADPDIVVTAHGYRLQFMYKFFLTRDLAPVGFYFAPHLSYSKTTLTDNDNINDFFIQTKLKISGDLGYQLITAGGFALDIYSGLGYVNRLFDFNLEDNSVFYEDLLRNKTGITFSFGCNFGYAFGK